MTPNTLTETYKTRWRTERCPYLPVPTDDFEQLITAWMATHPTEFMALHYTGGHTIAGLWGLGQFVAMQTEEGA